MNQQRNLILFLVGSVALLGLSSWLNQKYAPETAPRPAVVQPVPAAPSAQPGPQASVGAAVAPAGELAQEHGSEALDLAFDRATGALRQATWKVDGTPFFPEGFPGLGAVMATRFETLQREEGPEAIRLTFGNAAGDRLTWSVPRKGLVLGLSWTTQRGTHVQALPLPTRLEDLKGLEVARVLTLTEKQLQTATWSSMLKDPFFSFLGAKRKPLPQPEMRLGMDAGLEKSGNHTHQYFAALWKLPAVPERDAAGLHLAPAQGHLEAQLYLGPKVVEQLKTFEAPFAQVVDFGFFGAVAKFFFWVLKGLHGLIGNWGWAIVIFSLAIRFALWPVNTKQIVGTLRMKEFEPHQKAIQAKYEKFGSDMTKKAEMQKELMELYKKNGYNPMGGCLPLLLQMPVFMALWSMLSNVFELRHAPWMGWIHDLSSKDPLFILPALMVLTMFVSSQMTPSVGDPQQAKMMKWMMPIMMGLFFWQVPAGLGLYYLIFNLVHLGQTWWTMKHYVPQPVKV
jgi:YidC/Oxa1 family membrane protein insertase